MKITFLHKLPTVCLAIALAATELPAVPARAKLEATLRPSASAPAALSITRIEPTSMRSDLGGTLTVLGADFDSTAVVRLLDIGVLATTFVNTTTLTALVPRDLAPRAYTVEVRNGVGDTDQLIEALTITPAPTQVPAPRPTDAPPPAPFVRPLMTVATFRTTPAPVLQGKTFTLTVLLKNVGDDTAFNIAMTVPAGDFLASGNAGTLIYPKLKPGETAQFDQAVTAKSGIGGGLKPLDLKLAYNDRNGGTYSDPAPIGITVAGVGVGPTPIPKTPQLVVTNYRTEPPILKPGTVFTLTLGVSNVGSADASRLSAVLGGAATSSTTTDGSGTGGVPGSGGDFATFGPIGSSNVKFIPSVTTTESVSIEQRLIVNSTAKPGAYTVKVSLVYDDPRSQRRTDDQVITLLVIQPPNVEIGYYHPADPAFAGQPWTMPVQVVNIGRATAQLGKMEVIAPDGVNVQNGSLFIGPLEAGGQFPMDALVTPVEPGPLELSVRVHYIDDFNEPKMISQTLVVEVQAAIEPPPVEPGGDGSDGTPPPPADESFFDMLLRAFLGLIGLDSGRPAIEPGGIPSDVGGPGKLAPEGPQPAPQVP